MIRFNLIGLWSGARAHKFNGRRTSALVRIPDSSRTLRYFRKVPTSDIRLNGKRPPTDTAIALALPKPQSQRFR
jgi:hypothetical protein